MMPNFFSFIKRIKYFFSYLITRLSPYTDHTSCGSRAGGSSFLWNQSSRLQSAALWRVFYFKASNRKTQTQTRLGTFAQKHSCELLFRATFFHLLLVSKLTSARLPRSAASSMSPDLDWNPAAQTRGRLCSSWSASRSQTRSVYV